MPYPGAWIQGDDYTRDQGALAPRGKEGQHNGTSFGGAPYDGAMNAALDAVVADTLLGPSAGGLMGSVSVTAATEHPDGSVDWTTQKTTGGGEWTAQGLLDVGYYYNTYIAPTRPVDAVGYEFESNTVTPVAAVLRLAVTAGGSGDGTIPSGVSATPRASIAVDILAGQTYAAATAPLTSYRAPTQALQLDLALTSYMGPQGECAVAVDVNKDVQWNYYDGTHPQLINASTSASTGATASRVIYTLHPPRYRWLYDTPQPTPGLPPLRQWPRRDGLGASTARRHYPPDRSAQASNRRAGGYY